ncbi:hypothetical protein A0H81_00517 [Grifola frondosa]|uniref:Anti-proliferative protein domain-containing protein n=1 Tax=Grifola frondosa TaxID=5627 RepID=A0A1C7MQ43_GRIFR|nr:hypothetical protein A0H81_00517 [Grifola frondosa]
MHYDLDVRQERYRNRTAAFSGQASDEPDMMIQDAATKHVHQISEVLDGRLQFNSNALDASYDDRGRANVVKRSAEDNERGGAVPIRSSPVSSRFQTSLLLDALLCFIVKWTLCYILHDRVQSSPHRLSIPHSHIIFSASTTASLIAGRYTSAILLNVNPTTAHLLLSSTFIEMAASTVAFGSLSVTLAQLQLALEANLTAQFASSWVPTEPLRGSGRRCLTLSPLGVPPRSIYNACKAANVEWSEWMAVLGGVEFDLFIDPGCISIRFGSWDAGKVSQFFTIWSEDTVLEPQAKRSMLQKEAQQQAERPVKVEPRFVAAKPQFKTLAQQLVEADQDEDEEIFVMIADEVREPTWLSDILGQFPVIPIPERSVSPVSVVSTHSRSSSSSSSSGFSFSSNESTDSYGSATTISLSSCSTSPEQKPKFKLSRRERARQARVFVDASKTAVTNYDGGKTTVLTGGVMLGGGAPKTKPVAAPKKAISSNCSWRSLRA